MAQEKEAESLEAHVSEMDNDRTLPDFQASQTLSSESEKMITQREIPVLPARF